MLFNSINFAIYLPIVFFLYWFIADRNLKFQNLLLLIASYIFYGWWDYRFLSLIFISSAVDFFVGIKVIDLKNVFYGKDNLFSNQDHLNRIGSKAFVLELAHQCSINNIACE